MTRSARRWLRPLLGALVLGVVLWRTGTGPFVAGVDALDPVALALASVLAVPITVACAWRWRLVSGGLGARIGLGAAVAACYRAQLLNATLPGGVVGDVHRGVSHGRATGRAGRGLHSVVWERVAGQVVFVVLGLFVLLLLPSPAPVPGAVWALLVVVVVVAAVLVLRGAAPALRRTWPGVVAASVVAAAGHVATYLLAADAVGVTAPLATLLPLGMLVLLAAGLPVNLAGWGPREGMAAWAFGAAGLGAEQGVATAVAYGALVLVATLPGALVLTASVVPRLARGGLAHG